ncbi:hypothetical protein, partial [Herbaspirillum chlorophenolicum]
MFEKIVLKRLIDGPPISLGELAEALLFYQNVHLVLDHSTLSHLIESIRMEGLLSLLGRKNVTAVYCEETLGISTTKRGVFEYHTPIGFYLSGDATGAVANNRRERLYLTLARYGYDKKQRERLASIFIAKVPMKRLTADDFVKGGVIKAMVKGLTNAPYLQAATRKIVENTVGAEDIRHDFKIDLFESEQEYIVTTDLDINAINNNRARFSPTLDAITKASILTELLAATTDTHLAAYYGGELYTSKISSEVIKVRHAMLLTRIGIDRRELDNFHEIVLPNSPSLSEVINSGEKTFDDFLRVLDKSQKFREWIGGISPDANIVSEYMTSVTSVDWISGVKGKILRYVLGGAVGTATGDIGGLAIGA